LHKEPTRQFLHSFQTVLEDKLPIASELRNEIRGITNSKLHAHTNAPESAFIHQYLVRNLFQLLLDHGLDKLEARKALLCEGYKNIPDYASGTPQHPLPHPFYKEIAPAALDLRRETRKVRRGPVNAYGSVVVGTSLTAEFAL
jgi:hypothetical protein